MRKIAAVVLGTIILSAPPVIGQDSDAAACAAIAADGQRLACYDAIFRTVPMATGEAVVIASEQMIPARPSGRGHASLRLICENGELQVRFGFAGQAVTITGTNGPITFQFDQNPPTVRNLEASADNLEIGYWRSVDSRVFLSRFAGADALRVRITPPNLRSLAVDFHIAEAMPQIQALSESCQ